MYLPFLPDRQCLDDANELIAMYGDFAGGEASARADASRDRGNHIHFCRWRQIERMIILMTVDAPIGTVH